MIIADINLDTPFLLAPLAGVTDGPMRTLCRRLGASMVWTEMVSAEGIARNGRKTVELIGFAERERPIAVQIFGARPEAMEVAADFVGRFRPDAIDINAGCPVKKVVKSGSGSALMKDPQLFRDIVSAVTGRSGCPVTVKMRSGWDDESINAPELAVAAEECGAAAVAIHPRTRAQVFSGLSDWTIIRRVKESVGIPVIGSGDVRTAEDGIRMLSETGCDGVMVGRGAMGDPWIFGRLAAAHAGRPPEPVPSLAERLEVAIEHLDLMVEAKGELRGVHEMRKHIVAYLRGFHGASKLRSELVILEGRDAVVSRLRRAIEELTPAGARPGGER